jgi:hypothetical protein
LRWIRRFWPLALVVVMAGTCQSNYAVAGTISEGLGPSTGNDSILDGPIDRTVVLTIPAGGLERVASGQMILRVDPGRDPFPPVRFDIGPPFDESVIVDEQGLNIHFEFDWKPPEDCNGGCELTVPLTIGYLEPEGTPRFSWSMEFGLFYGGAVPEQMEGGPDRAFTAVVVSPADTDT